MKCFVGWRRFDYSLLDHILFNNGRLSGDLGLILDQCGQQALLDRLVLRTYWANLLFVQLFQRNAQNLFGVKLADFLVIIRQGTDDLTGLLILLVHPRHGALVGRIRQFRRYPAQRNVQCLDIALKGQIGLGWADSSLRNTA